MWEERKSLDDMQGTEAPRPYEDLTNYESIESIIYHEIYHTLGDGLFCETLRMQSG